MSERMLGFDERSAKLNEPMSKLDERSLKLDERFAKLDQLLQNPDERSLKLDERLPKLDERLRAIASMVRGGFSCADIGTDHGYLIAWLAASGRIPSGYACDVNAQPLQKAAYTLSEYGVADRVKLMLCDGLSGIPAGDVREIVIAGMGGDLTWKIISASDWTRDPELHFVLQPMTKPQHLRRALYESGYVINRELAVVSGGFPYAVMSVSYAGGRRELSDEAALVGELLHDSGAAARLYVERTSRLVEARVRGLEESGKDPDRLERERKLLATLRGL